MASNETSNLTFYLIAIVAGSLVGAIGTLFHWGSDYLLAVHRTFEANLPLGLHVGASAAVSAVLVAVAWVLVRRFAPEAAGSGVHEIEGAMEGLRPLRWQRVLPVKFAGGIMSIGSGLVVGREGPTIHIGSCICTALAMRLQLGKNERRGLMAAGAAAGLAVAFNAPVAAVLFVIEETRRQFPYTFRTYAGVILASLFAAFITEELAGAAPDLAITVAEKPVWHMVLFLALGGLIGVFGVVFNRTLLLTLNLFEWLRARVSIALPLAVGAITGALLAVLPNAVQGGEDLIGQIVVESHAAGYLLLLVAVRFGTTMTSYAVGVPGGIFAPILALATCTGLAFAALLNMTPLPEPVDPASMAVVAMAALFTSTVRAPMVGVVLVAELTGAYDLFLPLLAACAASHLTAQALGGQPIYEQLLERALARAPEAHEGKSVPVPAPAPASAAAPSVGL